MKLVDLTFPLGPGTPAVEGDPPVTLRRVRSHEDDGYQVTAICLGSHSGTHLDAPRHFFPAGATLDSFPLDRLVRPGWVVDVRPAEVLPAATTDSSAASDSTQPWQQSGTPPLPPLGTAATTMPLIAPVEARVTPGALAARLQDVVLGPGDLLLLWTAGALLDDDAIPLLLKSGAGLVGTDAPSLDEEPYPAHHLLLDHGVLLAENLANLDKLGPGKVMCAFLPLALLEADGAPLRAVGWR